MFRPCEESLDVSREFPEFSVPPGRSPASGERTLNDVTDQSFLQTIRSSYDTVAVDYAQRFGAELADKPIDRALLAAFSELVVATDGPIADIGCGPGHITAHLHRLGLSVFGIDLSPAMVAVARESHPELRFEEGSMNNLDLADGCLGGIVAMYSIIHQPPERLPGVFAEFARVLAPGGRLLLAFQSGDERRHIDEWFGSAVSLDAYALDPGRMVELLGQAGFTMTARMDREADASEKMPRSYLLASKASASGAK
jgi:SAM-dependent methyltransferase